MCAGGGSVALKGFVYQFLHTLMTLLDGTSPVRVCVEGAPTEQAGQPTDLLLQIEGREDLETETAGRRQLFQLKDHATFGAAEFAEEALKRFAREYVALRAADAEFVLFMSASVGGGFYEPLAGSCARLAEWRSTGHAPDVAALHFGDDLASSPVSVPEAAIWASARRGDGRPAPVPRGLVPTDGVPEFLSWLSECLFLREADITSEADLVDFLSRVRIDDGNAAQALRVAVLDRLEGRLPVDIAPQRLALAIGKLVDRAARHGGEWVTGHALLQELGIPLAEVSWGAAQAGCMGRILQAHPLSREGEEPYQERPEGLAHLRLWLQDPEARPMFVLASHGRTGKSRLLRRFAANVADVAPALLIEPSTSDDDIRDELLAAAGWEGTSGTEWTLAALLGRMQRQPDRPDGTPSAVLLVDGFSGTDGHAPRVERLRRLVTDRGGLILIAAQQAALRMLDDTTREAWARATWQAGRPSPAAPGGAASVPSYDLPYREEPGEGKLLAVAERVARRCGRTADDVRSALETLATAACAPQTPTGVVQDGQAISMEWWDWGSTRWEAFPQAVVEEGLFMRLPGDALRLAQSAPAVDLVRSHVAGMDAGGQEALSSSLASIWPPHGAVLEGFVLWLRDVAGEADDERLVALLRPWTEGPADAWTPWVFEMTGPTAIRALRAIAEGEAADVPADPVEEAAARHRVRRLFGLIKAAGPPNLGEVALGWAHQTHSGWLERQILTFFSPESGEAGLGALLDQLRRLSTGGDPL